MLVAVAAVLSRPASVRVVPLTTSEPAAVPTTAPALSPIDGRCHRQVAEDLCGDTERWSSAAAADEAAGQGARVLAVLVGDLAGARPSGRSRWPAG